MKSFLKFIIPLLFCQDICSNNINTGTTTTKSVRIQYVYLFK